MKITVEHPMLLLLIPLLSSAVIFSLRKYWPEGRTGRNAAAALRIVLIACIVCAMADIKAITGGGGTDTVFLIDVSESFAASRDWAAAQVRDAIKKMPAKNKAGVVAFGADARVEQFMSDAGMFSSIETSPVATATNIEKAVITGLAMFDDGAGKRMVLITDGRQNDGSVENLGAMLSAENVELKVLKKDYDIGAEAYISDMSMPEKIQAGDKFKVKVKIKSTAKMGAILQLYADGKLGREERVELQKGSNSFIFEDKAAKAGFAEYKAAITPDEDYVAANNEYAAYVLASAPQKILLIEGKRGEAAEFQELLAAANEMCDTAVPNAAPDSVNEMNEYKCIIAENTDVESLPAGFLNSIDSYVKDYGGGFIAVGGKNSFALGGYMDTVLEKILPVSMDISRKKKIPTMSMAMVIDCSGSMSGKKIEMAMEAAARAVDGLRGSDRVGVMSFDDAYRWNVKMQKTGGRKDQIKKNIFEIGSGNGGTSIFPALTEAYEKIKNEDAKIKHIVILTDGQDDFRNGYPNLLKKIENDKVTLSAISVGSDADAAFLKRLASDGGGRFYDSADGKKLPRIFAREVYLAQKKYLVNRVFTPIVKNMGGVLGDEISDGLPKMAGYVATVAKPEAMQVLSSDIDDDPILACRQYGLGKTAAFTSDVTNQWSANYAKWDGYSDFWKSILNWVVDADENGESTVSVSQKGNGCKITYSTKKYSDDAKVYALFTDEDGGRTKIELKASSPGTFEGEIEFLESGIYAVNVTRSESEKTVDAKNTKLAMQYSPEYRFDDADGALDELVGQTGGEYVDSLSHIFEGELEKSAAMTELEPLFLMMAAAFFLVDVAYRRLDLKPFAKIAEKSFFAVKGKDGRGRGKGRKSHSSD